MTSIFKPGDHVVIARRDPVHGLCGFKANLLGIRGVIESVAVAPDYPSPSYVVRIRHPVSLREISPTLPGSMLDRDESGGRTIIIPGSKKLEM